MPLRVKLTVKRGRTGELLDMAGDRRRFPNVAGIAHCKKGGSGAPCVVLTYRSGYEPSDDEIARIAKRYGGLGCVSGVSVMAEADEPAIPPARGALHLFFDIDGIPASGGGSGAARGRVRRAFRRMIEDGHRVYLASGRHAEQVNLDIREYGTERVGIAENGGMLASPDGNVRLGDRAEPNKVLWHMIEKYGRRGVEDIPEGMRVTERIFHRFVPEREFRRQARMSGAAADVHAGRMSYRVAGRGVDKGSALRRIREDAPLGDCDVAVAVGDSGLDAPMFKEARWSFAMQGADRLARKSATIELDGDCSGAAAEIYDRWLAPARG